jgi:hypothetical protein
LIEAWKGCGSERAGRGKTEKLKKLGLESEKARSLKEQWPLGSTKRLCTVLYRKRLFTDIKTGIGSEKFMDPWISEGHDPKKATHLARLGK